MYLSKRLYTKSSRRKMRSMKKVTKNVKKEEGKRFVLQSITLPRKKRKEGQELSRKLRLV